MFVKCITSLTVRLSSVSKKNQQKDNNAWKVSAFWNRFFIPRKNIRHFARTIYWRERSGPYWIPLNPLLPLRTSEEAASWTLTQRWKCVKRALECFTSSNNRVSSNWKSPEAASWWALPRIAAVSILGIPRSAGWSVLPEGFGVVLTKMQQPILMQGVRLQCAWETTKKTQGVLPMPVQCWATVCDAGTT